MSYERPTRSPILTLCETFGLTTQERLDRRINQQRLEEILNNEQTAIHTMDESNNNYGEFLFVTVSRPVTGERQCVTFFGLGFHEYRERWLTDEWFWYQAHAFPAVLEQIISKEETLAALRSRLDSITPYCEDDVQTGRGALFEMLADLTDEDGAWAEMQDMDELNGWLTDGLS